ncbi:MAG: SDR family oxidoreductase [Undibacterium sp.]|nr:SDR family oxidoreductase [Opitutaceae bacterium]
MAKTKIAGPVSPDSAPDAPLAGKVAFITGAAEGIGRASAQRLARAGARVALVGRTADVLQKTCSEIRAAGGEVLALVADVSRPATMERAFARTMRRWGRLDIVMANAGINGVWAPLARLKLSDWDETISINLRGTFLTVKLAAALMRKRGGSIVVTASVNGTRMFSNTGATAYAVSKAGQVALARMCALELAPARIRVNTICPGAITTEIAANTRRRGLHRVGTPVKFPAGKIPLTRGAPGSAEQVAELVLFLAGDTSSHITGTEVYIDGGQSLLQG